MTRPCWIVVGTDFGPAADHALAHAVVLAAGSRSHVALVHVYVDPGPDEDAIRAELAAKLSDAIARSSAARRGVHVEPMLRRGEVWEKLRNVATDMGADYLVIGQQPRAVLVIPHAETP